MPTDCSLCSLQPETALSRSSVHRSQVPALQAQQFGPGLVVRILEFERLDLLAALGDLVGRRDDLGDIVLTLAEMAVELRDPVPEPVHILQEFLHLDLN